MRRKSLNILIGTNIAMMAACSAAIAQPCVPGWHSVGGGMNGAVSALALFREGGQDVLFAVGGFNQGGSVITGPVARWNGAEWSNVGGVYFNNWVEAMIVHDDGSGPALYVGGRLGPVPGFDGRGVARWDGVSWSAVGAGLIPNDYGVRSFAEYDDGGGLSLYAGGFFSVAGEPTNAPRNLARWDGSTWTPFAGTNGVVLAMAVFDDGSGPALFCTGGFTTIGGIAAGGAARWNGTAWEPSHGTWNAVLGYNFANFTDGGEEKLFLAGRFTDSTQSLRPALARWTGGDWELVGVPAGPNDIVGNVKAWDDGSGLAMYVSGRFLQIGGVTSSNIARYDGESWSAVGGGYPGTGVASALLGVDSGPDGRALYLGGTLNTTVPGMGRRIARYDPCFVPCYANCDGSTTAPILNVEDFMCFINEFSAGMSVPQEQQIGHYANCDGSTEAPVLNVDDFVCFINAFAQGCL